jgi:hypothetical protein
MATYRAKYGMDMNYIGQTGVSVAQMESLQVKDGRWAPVADKPLGY